MEDSVISILRKHSGVFSKQKNDLGTFRGIEHQIEVNQRQPIYWKPYKIPYALEEEVEKKICELLKNGIIRECSSPWNSPLIPIRKKSGDLRLCVDYRRLNQITVKKVFPIPDHQQIIDCLSGSNYFSTLDLSQGFYQIPLRKADQEKSAFTIRSGQYCFTRMPFGLTNSPCTFQLVLNKVMRKVNWKKCVIFMDDILVFGKSEKEHNSNLEDVLHILEENGLKITPTKCGILKEEVTFLGHIISKNGVRTDPSKIASMKELNEPTNRKELQTFLGMCSYYRKFIKDFASISSPLYDLTSTKQKFEWNTAHSKAFHELKEKLSMPPILSYPNKKDKFVLYTDASDYAIGSVLCQSQNKEEKVIAYASRKLTKSEINYSVTKKELLAIINFIRHFKHYLWGVEFEVKTDHRSLEYVLKGNQITSTQFCRWRSELEQYDFKVKYVKGKENGMADGMSRPQRQSMTGNVRVMREIDDISVDKNIQTITKLIESNRINEPNPVELRSLNQEAKILWARRGELEIHEKDLCLRKMNGNFRIIIPFQKRNNITKQYHEQHCHIGTQKTLMLLKERFYWPKMEETVNSIVESCRECSLVKRKSPRDKAPLQGTLTGEVNERISIDLTGPFYTTASGNRYILGVIDNFSKFCSLIPIKNAEANSVCQALYGNWISIFGAPLEIISDNGSSFKNQLKKELCELLGIKESHSPPYYPQANGLIERLFRTAKTLIKTTIAKNHKDWDEVLPTVNMALRNSVSRSTKFTPYEIMFGKTARLPLDWQFHTNHVNSECLLEGEYMIRMRRHMYETENIVRNNLATSLKKQADYYNKRNLNKKFHVGELVLVRQSRKQKDFRKFDYNGPYEIVRKLGEWTYELKHTISEEIMRRSYNQIKKYRKPMNNFINDESYNIERNEGNGSNIINDLESNTNNNVQGVGSCRSARNGSSGNSNRTIGNRRSARPKQQPDRFGFPFKSEARKYL